MRAVLSACGLRRFRTAHSRSVTGELMRQRRSFRIVRFGRFSAAPPTARNGKFVNDRALSRAASRVPFASGESTHRLYVGLDSNTPPHGDEHCPSPAGPGALPRHGSRLAHCDSDVAHNHQFVPISRVAASPAFERTARGADVVAAKALLAQHDALARPGLDHHLVPAPQPHPKRRCAVRIVHAVRGDPIHVAQPFVRAHLAPSAPSAHRSSCGRHHCGSSGPHCASRCTLRVGSESPDDPRQLGATSPVIITAGTARTQPRASIAQTFGPA